MCQFVEMEPIRISSSSYSGISRHHNLFVEMGIYPFHQYQVVGRALPTATDEKPKIYRMKLWAVNEVCAKSKFWYFFRLKKVKKSNGQMLAINEVDPDLKLMVQFLSECDILPTGLQFRIPLGYSWLQTFEFLGYDIFTTFEILA